MVRTCVQSLFDEVFKIDYTLSIQSNFCQVSTGKLTFDLRSSPQLLVILQCKKSSLFFPVNTIPVLKYMNYLLCNCSYCENWCPFVTPTEELSSKVFLTCMLKCCTTCCVASTALIIQTHKNMKSTQYLTLAAWPLLGCVVIWIIHSTVTHMFFDPGTYSVSHIGNSQNTLTAVKKDCGTV